jgi:asparagine synthase (glutamine-hydrolysing)
MCGISLIWDKRGKLDSAPIKAMVQSLDHRGPDYSNTISRAFKEGTLYLGHNRLKIIDTSDNSNQPLLNEDFGLLYNGELYEEDHLDSDTQWLFSQLQDHGPLKFFNGTYSSVWIDFNNEEIFASRDASGVKPLYRYEDEDYLILASESKAIFASGLVEKKLNGAQIKHYLRYKFCEPGASFFIGIHKIMKGEVSACVKKQIVAEQHISVVTESSESFHELMSRRVSRQFKADVPIGLFLSGGVDSTLLLALLHEQGLHNIPTFSIGGSAGHMDTDDLAYAKKASVLYKSEHHEINVNSDLLDGLIEHIHPDESLVADSASLYTDALASEAVTHVKSVLTGAGADELFGGYNRHQAFNFYLKNQNLPFGIGRRLPDGFNHPLRKKFRLLKKLSLGVGSNPQETYANFVSLIWRPETTNELPVTNLQEALHWDLNEYLPEDILRITDLYTMRHGLEARTPYLDQEIVAFAQGLTADKKVDKEPKGILKDLLAKLGGKEFADRPKEGLGIPFGAWIREECWQHLLDFAQNKSHPVFMYLEYELFNKRLEEHLKHRADHGPDLWAVVQLAKWLELQ